MDWTAYENIMMVDREMIVLKSTLGLKYLGLISLLLANYSWIKPLCFNFPGINGNSPGSGICQRNKVIWFTEETAQWTSVTGLIHQRLSCCVPTVIIYSSRNWLQFWLILLSLGAERRNKAGLTLLGDSLCQKDITVLLLANNGH